MSILVGADGTHSRVRAALDIKLHTKATAFGATALIPNKADRSEEMEISSAIQYEDGFLRRIKAPSVSIIFIQFPQNASKHRFQKALEAQGWHQEAESLRENQVFLLADIQISLQQAETFSNEKKQALLVGDAAASASFFQGMGANTAFMSAKIAGRFFQEIKTSPETAFQNFNQAIQKTTDAMIEDSAFLFSP